MGKIFWHFLSRHLVCVGGAARGGPTNQRPKQNERKNMKTMNSTKHAGKITSFALGLALLPLAAFGQSNYATSYTFTTFAGNNGYGSADGTNSAARFAANSGAAVDS